MIKITITIPEEGSKWKYSITGKTQGRHRASAGTLFTSIKSYLLASSLKEKTCVVIKETTDTTPEIVNQSLASKDASYLLWTLSVFLEDYLSQKTLNEAESSYLKDK